MYTHINRNLIGTNGQNVYMYVFIYMYQCKSNDFMQLFKSVSPVKQTCLASHKLQVDLMNQFTLCNWYSVSLFYAIKLNMR